MKLKEKRINTVTRFPASPDLSDFKEAKKGRGKKKMLRKENITRMQMNKNVILCKSNTKTGEKIRRKVF